MEMLTIEKMTEEELKELYKSLRDKTGFCIKAAQELKKIGVHRSPGTIRTHWFGSGRLTGGMPDNKKIRRVLQRELERSPKKL